MKILITGVMTVASCICLIGQAAMQITPGTHVISNNNGYVVLNNIDLINDGTVDHLPGDGVYKFAGGTDMLVGGNGMTNLDRLHLYKDPASQLVLESDISIITEIDFQGGLFDLKDHHVQLWTTGQLVNEGESSRATTSGAGYLETQAYLDAPSSANPGNLGAVISSSGNLGYTTIRRGHKIQTGISSESSSIERFYDILPENIVGLQPTLRLYYFDAELDGTAENSLNQWKSKDSVAWAFVGHNTRDEVLNFVEKQNIGTFHFTRWTLAEALAPVITCPEDITVNDSEGKCEQLIELTGNNAATATGSPDPVITYFIDGNPITSPYLFPKGTTTVMATASNGIAPDDTCYFDVTVTCDHNPGMIASPSTGQLESELSILTYPNPVGDHFILRLWGDQCPNASIRIFNAIGMVVEEKRSVAIPGIWKFDAEHYSPGTYIIEIESNGTKETTTVVKVGH